MNNNNQEDTVRTYYSDLLEAFGEKIGVDVKPDPVMLYFGFSSVFQIANSTKHCPEFHNIHKGGKDKQSLTVQRIVSSFNAAEVPLHKFHGDLSKTSVVPFDKWPSLQLANKMRIVKCIGYLWPICKNAYESKKSVLKKNKKNNGEDSVSSMYRSAVEDSGVSDNMKKMMETVLSGIEETGLDQQAEQLAENQDSFDLSKIAQMMSVLTTQITKNAPEDGDSSIDAIRQNHNDIVALADTFQNSEIFKSIGKDGLGGAAHYLLEYAKNASKSMVEQAEEKAAFDGTLD